MGRAALRLGHAPVHARPAARRRAGAVRRVRRSGAVARIPRDRPRRPEPVGLLPRRRRPPPAGRRPARGRGQGVRRLQPVGHRHPAVPRRRDRAGRAGRRAPDRRGLPRHPQGGWDRAARRAGRRACRSSGGGRVDPPARAAGRPSAVVGAVVRRLADTGHRPLALVRAAAPDAPRAPLAPRPRRGAPVGVAQRDGCHGLGGRLRRLGGLVRPRRPDPAPDGQGAAGAARPVRRR